MKVCRSAYWSRNNNTSSINCLPNSSQVYSASDFSDQLRSKLLLSKLLGNTEEVDLGKLNVSFLDFALDWGTCNKCEKLFAICGSYTEMPFFGVARDKQSPLDEFNLILKPESAISILNIVLFQKLKYFIDLFLISEIESGPFKTSRKLDRLLLNILQFFVFDLSFFLDLISQTSVLGNWLCVPELMIFIKR